MGQNTKKVLVTGAGGMLGADVCRALRERNIQYIDTGKSDMDVTDELQVGHVMDIVSPDVVIHTAAWTDVAGAEEPENREAAESVNVTGTANVAEACSGHGSSLIYISSDYVFQGDLNVPIPAEGVPARPVNWYGMTKYLGERVAGRLLDGLFIVRTSWLYGKGRQNFVTAMLEAADAAERGGGAVRVVTDQTSRPTNTEDLAGLLADMALTDRYGIYHATGEGRPVSRFDMVKELYRLAGKDVRVEPALSADFNGGRPKRPEWSVLDTSKLEESGFERLPDWEESLAGFLGKADK